MNKVITKDYPENITNGFMVCGVNYGFSEADERAEARGEDAAPNIPSFFSDLTVRKTDRFRQRAIRWLKGWGVPLAEQPGHEGKLEKSFFQCNWLDTQTRGVTGSDTVTINDLVRDSDGFLELLESRRPAVVFLFGSNLLEALNDIRIRPRVEQLLGERPNPATFTAEPPDYTGRKFNVRIQRFPNAIVVGSPHPQARGLPDAYMAAIKLPEYLQEILRSRMP